MGCLACLAVAFAVAPALSARALTTALTLGRPQAETRSLNADWRFSWADETIPLKKAMASMAKGGVAVSDPAYDDGAWESVSLPHPVNAHDSFNDRAVDAGEASFRRGVMFSRKRFALPTKKQLVKNMRELAKVCAEMCEHRSCIQEEQELEKLAHDYAKRFYGLDWSHDINVYTFFDREYTYPEIGRGCTYPKTLVIGYGSTDYERIALA